MSSSQRSIAPWGAGGRRAALWVAAFALLPTACWGPWDEESPEAAAMGEAPADEDIDPEPETPEAPDAGLTAETTDATLEADGGAAVEVQPATDASPEAGDPPEGDASPDAGLAAELQTPAAPDDPALADEEGEAAITDEAPVTWTRGLEPCEFGLGATFALSSIVPPPRDGGYEAPEQVETASLSASLESASDGDLDLAVGFADDAGYVLCRVDADIAVWRPDPGSGRPLIAWNFADGARPVVVGVPHPFNERGTLEQGRYAFDVHGARVLVVSGTHRCAATSVSGCGGETAVCDAGLAPYRLSDPAHSEATLFHHVHVTLTRLLPDDLVISLHGMAEKGVSVSNGTALPVEGGSAVARAMRALQRAFPGQRVTTCNPHPGVSPVPRLCGTTNLQGRLVNGAFDACDEEADHATQRFLHLEQGRALRRTPRAVVDALFGALFGAL